MRAWLPLLEERLRSIGGADRDSLLSSAQGRARFMGGAYLVAATVVLATMPLPQPADTNIPGQLTLIGIGYLLGVFLIVGGKRVPMPALWAIAAAGTLMLSLGMVWTSGRTAVYAMTYVWIALTVFYFFSWRAALLQVGLVAAAYAAVLEVERPEAGAEQWMITAGTVLVTGLLVGFLRHRVERLVQQLSDAARTDPLTGLSNRRGFEAILDLEFERSRRSERPMHLLVADLDHFKTVNDRLGHEGGDRVLQRFADELRRISRRVDTVARLGGDEFAMILPEIDKTGAHVFAERLRKAVGGAFAEHTIPLTVSVGTAEFPTDGVSKEVLFQAADRALYAAKQVGRDRAVSFNSDLASFLPVGETPRQARGEKHLSAVLALAEALDVRDGGAAHHGAAHHSTAVGHYSFLVATELGFSGAAAERMRLAGLLHDIGKIGVQDNLLGKAGALTESEWEEIRTHPQLGARILATANLEDIAIWVLAHHERPDGRGYPLGLRGERIPLEARMLAVADAYATMRSVRAYSPAMSHSEAERELLRFSGKQFDRAVVAALLESLRLAPASLG